jgi:peptidoglycan/LPS O-acetylase OafA/YrhL
VNGMKYEPSLDGLRAIAVSAVVIYHVNSNILPGGWSGVDLFFVLSGFLITRLLSDETARTGHIAIKRFYARRLLRLTPAFWCLLAFVLTLAALEHSRALLESAMISGAYMMNWSRAFKRGAQELLGHTWSLSMEEQFYIFWPLLFGRIKQVHPKRWLVVLIIVVVAWRFSLVMTGASPSRTYNGFDTHSDALLAGCLLALVRIPENLSALFGRLNFIPLTIASIILLSMRYETKFGESIGLVLTALVSVWLVIASLQDGFLKRFLASPALRFTGKMSYGIYLWHYPLIMLLQPRFGLLGGLLAVVLAYGAAVLSYFTVERAFRRLRVRFEAAAASRQLAANVAVAPDEISPEFTFEDRGQGAMME